MTTPPTDPLFRYQWFLSNTGQSGGAIGSDINVLPVWTNYTGKGVRVGIVDDGVQLDQPDLKANIDLAGSWNAVANAPGGGAFGDNNHGTAVAGLVGEVANNGIGGSGVAPDATLQAYLINLGGKGPTQAFIAFQKALENKADVVNNSWGASAAFAANAKDPDQAAEFAALDALGSQGRGGKGSVVLFANGNDGAKGYDGNLDNLLNSRHVIAVGAIDDASVVTSYSTPGANLLISAPAGASTPQAEDRPGNGVLTTDRTGSDGYNKLAGVSGDYAYNFNGTSAATPVASGVVALMLQANPNLGYRDVQEILAHSARFVDTGGTSWTLTHPGSTPWNGGGEMFSRDYGFGEVDAHGAVRLAEVYPYLHSAPRSDANVVQTTASIPVNTEIDSDPAPGEDDDFPGLSNQVAFGVALPAGVDLNHLDLNLTAQVDHPSALTVTLTSPSGTTVVMINQPANAGSAWPQGGFSMGTDAFWGEQSGGNWLVRVAIGGEKEVGTVQSATLTGYGDATSTQKEFVYTDSFATVVLTDSQHPGGAAPRNLIEVRTGETAVIDAAAMSSDVTVNLDPGVRLARIAGQSINIDPATRVTKVFTGDGNDNLVGDAGDNAFLAGRGSNLIDGGAGVDTALYVGSRAAYTVNYDANGVFTASSQQLPSSDTAIHIEKAGFSEGTMFVQAATDTGLAIAALYNGLLFRAIDANGYRYWTNAAVQGANLPSIETSFQSSPEFAAGPGKLSNAAFVDSAYQQLLHRPADAPGAAYWTQQLASGSQSRADMVVAMSHSAEYDATQLVGVVSAINSLGNLWS